ncbi:hypothetical protein O181_084263 [Austropuccinia psidii MF-1]|uniref:Uncharacterized protein n=1 Tax=Austropuccinia psidii MF-1 TaxID=1389203 RepID=A0A9Q3FQY9_9BASI|nr:hypothetical protein [Austropuccinia psidii MF-1]
MEKENMMLLTEEWSKKNTPPPKKAPKPEAVPTQKSIHNLRTRAKAKHQPQNHTARATGCHGKCVSDGQNHYGITEKEGSQI